MRLNVALLSSKKVRKEFGNLAQAVAKVFPLKLAVDNRSFIPHVTLYQLVVTYRNLPRLEGIVRELAAGSPLLRLCTTRLGSGDNNSFDINIQRSPELACLHRKALEMFSCCRSGNVSAGKPPITAREKDNLKRFGSRRVLALYRPHVTLGLARRTSDMPGIKNFLRKRRIPAFLASEIAITEINAFGQATYIIKSFYLKKL